MNYIPKQLKYISIVLLVSLILFTAYLIIFPVRTLGKVLEQKEISLKKHYAFSIFPVAWSEAVDDVLGARTKPASELDVYSDDPQEIEKLIACLDSLKVRKKLEKSHLFSEEHESESGYEYWISFIGPAPIDLRLCEEETCFETSPQRACSFDFNTYLLVDCPENQEILKEILNFLSAKLTP